MADSMKRSEHLISGDSGYFGSYDTVSSSFPHDSLEIVQLHSTEESRDPIDFLPATIDDVDDEVGEIQEQTNIPWIRKVQNFFLEWRRVGKNISPQDVTHLLTELLSKEDIDAAQRCLWQIRHSGGIWAAQGEAYESEDELVNLAVWIADSHGRLNQQNHCGQTLLHIAAACCKAETVRNIYTHGGDLKYKDAWGNNALHVAAMKGYADTIKALNTPATHEETRHDLFKVVYKSVRRPEDVNHINLNGMAPIHIAADAGHHDALRALCQYAKPDVDIRESKAGDAAAHLSVKSGSLECLRVCLQYGADSEVRNYAGYTALQLADAYNRKDMVDLCIERGADERQLENTTEDQVMDENSEEERTDCGLVAPDETSTMHQVRSGIGAMSLG